MDFLFVKDLGILNGEVSLENILIIDNNIYSFAFNLENGIPIINFLGDKNDHELLKVMKYLYYLKDFKNLKEENEKTYNLKKIFDSNIETYIKYYDECSEEWH
jgi:CTD small phosphatase-like protein 2